MICNGDSKAACISGDGECVGKIAGKADIIRQVIDLEDGVDDIHLPVGCLGLTFKNKHITFKLVGLVMLKVIHEDVVDGDSAGVVWVELEGLIEGFLVAMVEEDDRDKRFLTVVANDLFRHVAEESLILMGEIVFVDIHKSRIFVLSAKVRLCVYMRKDRKKAGPSSLEDTRPQSPRLGIIGFLTSARFKFLGNWRTINRQFFIKFCK